MKIIVEPSCATPLAIVLRNKEFFKGKNVALVLTGKLNDCFIFFQVAMWILEILRSPLEVYWNELFIKIFKFFNYFLKNKGFYKYDKFYFYIFI